MSQDSRVEDSLRRLRAQLDAADATRREQKSASLNGYWARRLGELHRARPPEYAAQQFAPDCYECGEDLLHGGKLEPSTLVLLAATMSRYRLRSSEMLSRISELCRNNPEGLTPKEQNDLSRAFANLRRNDDPIIDRHVAALQGATDWILDDVVASLWSLLLAERDVPSLFGKDALLQLGQHGFKQFFRFRDLAHLQLMCGFEVPEEIATRARNTRPRTSDLEGSQSPLEEQIAEGLTALGVSFRQQEEIAGYHADFLVHTERGMVVIEALGRHVHFLSELRAHTHPGRQQLYHLTDELRGEDLLRVRIFRKLGYRVALLTGNDVRKKLEHRATALEETLRSAE